MSYTLSTEMSLVSQWPWTAKQGDGLGLGINSTGAHFLGGLLLVCSTDTFFTSSIILGLADYLHNLLHTYWGVLLVGITLPVGLGDTIQHASLLDGTDIGRTVAPL